MTVTKTLLAVTLSGLTLLGLQACDEGPFEEAGENIDQGIENTGDALDDAADEIDQEF